MLKFFFNFLLIVFSTSLLMLSCVANNNGYMLKKAASIGDTLMIQELLTKGVDVDANSKNGNITPLWIASQKGYPEAVKLLVESGADLDVKVGGITPLMLASGDGNIEIVKLLLTAGADPTVRSHIGTVQNNNKTLQIHISALKEARRNGYDDIVELLKKYGATE